jgi:hypothetical protein
MLLFNSWRTLVVSFVMELKRGETITITCTYFSFPQFFFSSSGCQTLSFSLSPLSLSLSQGMLNQCLRKKVCRLKESESTLYSCLTRASCFGLFFRRLIHFFSLPFIPLFLQFTLVLLTASCSQVFVDLFCESEEMKCKVVVRIQK